VIGEPRLETLDAFTLQDELLGLKPTVSVAGEVSCVHRAVRFESLIGFESDPRSARAMRGQTSPTGNIHAEVEDITDILAIKGVFLKAAFVLSPSKCKGFLCGDPSKCQIQDWPTDYNYRV
jgi:hypothetical protein